MAEMKTFSQDLRTPKEADDLFFTYCSATRRKAAEECVPYHMDIEINNRCTGGCRFCFNSSNPQGDMYIPKEKIFQLIDEGYQLGARQILWNGGEPLFHPDFFEITEYAGEKGMKCAFFTSGIPVTKKIARRLVGTPNLQAMAINIDAFDQAIFNQLHTKPGALKRKIEAIHNMLDAGMPPSRLLPSICLTKPSCETIEETVDRYVDEFGARMVYYFTFIPSGYGMDNKPWEPSLSQIKKACEYRAQRTSPHWLRIGPLDCNVTHCRIKIYITYWGDVLPCNFLTHLSAGSIYEKSLIDIHESNREWLHFKNFEIKGKCGQCENNDVCFGCRGKAYWYLGDEHLSDPKCWMNPEAKEYYCQ
ncbi:MAG: hypothetical protein A3G93_08635 [Nitrospinae bacterium RIFCSPLOWO2_12_FULL_45_22]|nr:MAG: hypothetical protein A3G93_08635 [Nitrospinae bacterium RIFCSPLOWO2_12_FULL_45_22]